MKKISSSLFAVVFVSSISFAQTCKRTISIVPSKELKVEITIIKGDLKGIARLSEVIPEGTVVTYPKSEDKSFNTANNKVNFFWLILPNADEFKVAYIVSTEKLGSGTYTLSGKFSYIDKDDPKHEKHEMDIDPTMFYISATHELKLDNTPAAIPNNNTISSSPANSEKASAVKYGIQVMSSAKKLPANYFSKNYNINEKVTVLELNGQFKYILGEFSSMNSTLSFREALNQKGLKDSFIVAFLNGKKITLAEAKELEANR